MNYKLKLVENDILRFELYNESEYLERKAANISKNGDSEPRLGDFLWSLLNESHQISAKHSSDLENMYSKNRTIYNIMSMLLLAEGKNISGITKLRNEIIIKGEGYWAGHYNFNKETKTKLNYFIGLGRADEIVINILLPIFSVYFEIFGNKDLSQKVLDLFLNYYQKEGNHLVDQVNDTLGLKNEKFRSVYYQGMIDLFRNYCIKKKCMECEIGKQVFN